MHKTPFTIEPHEAAGNKFRTLPRLLSELAVDLGHASSVKVSDDLIRLQPRLGRIRSDLEDHLFAEHPEIDTKSGLHIYS